MANGNVIRGTRVGAGPSGEHERGQAAPRVRVGFHCANGHASTPTFAQDADIPDEWDCPKCGLPAGQDAANPPAARAAEPYKTHIAYVRERRTDADGSALLDEALQKLRASEGRA